MSLVADSRAKNSVCVVRRPVLTLVPGRKEGRICCMGTVHC
jgi:hypothetical protein